ncbi:hypothetical protein ACLK31_14655, partial [Leptospira borgpetersenii]
LEKTQHLALYESLEKTQHLALYESLEKTQHLALYESLDRKGQHFSLKNSVETLFMKAFQL